MTSILALAAILAPSAQPAGIEPLPRRVMLGAQVAADPNGGIAIQQVLPDGTAEKSSLENGDVLLEIGGKRLETVASLGPIMRDLTAGNTVAAKIRRDGEEQTVTLNLAGRALDPGTDKVEVIYDQVMSLGERMRTIITKPRKAGKHPVIFFVQGLQYGSVETPLSQSMYMTDFLNYFAEDYVTLRGEKPGCGDSDGGPNEAVTFWRESDIYLQALRAVKKYDYVDADRIYIFGHSMGGIMGPIAASKEPVAGVCAYGTGVEPWGDYMIRNTRRQAVLGGANEEQADAQARDQRQMVELCFNQGLSPAQALAADPTLANHINSTSSPDRQIYVARSYRFHQELANADMISFWEQLECPVLGLYGEADFVSFEDDHQRLARIAKSGTFIKVPGADHGFFKKADFAESIRDWGRPGEVNPAVMKAFRDWIESL